MNCVICEQPVTNGLRYREGEVHAICRDNCYRWMRRRPRLIEAWRSLKAAIHRFSEVSYGD